MEKRQHAKTPVDTGGKAGWQNLFDHGIWEKSF
jgi:hypothetical protein